MRRAWFQFLFRPVCSFTFVGFAGVCVAVPARAQTDFVREFAKNKPRVLIIASGPEARPAAESFYFTLVRNGDFRGHKPDDARLVSPGEADGLLGSGAKEWSRCSLVFFLAGKDSTNVLPPRLSALLPISTNIVGSRVSVVEAIKDAERPGEPTFRVGVYAPDAPRLARLAQRFATRRVDNFRDLAFREQYATNRVALFSDAEEQTVLAEWGRVSTPNVWNEVTWYPLSARSGLTPEQLAECTEVYFVNRSAPDAPLPSLAQNALASLSARPASVLVAQTNTAGENPVVVVSAPSRALLETRIARRRTVDELKQESPVFEAVDLSRTGPTSLLIVGGSQLSSDLMNGLHADLSGRLRQIGIPVEPRGPLLTKMEGDLALQMAQGATDTKGYLRRRIPTRYVWAFTLTDIQGATTFRAQEQKVTPDFPRFDDAEPGRPRRGRDEDEDQYQRRLRDWRDNWNRWDRKRRDYNDRFRTDSCDWKQWVEYEQTARVTGRLQLIDTKSTNGAAFVWETACSADTTQTGRQVDTQHVSVRGHDTRPNSLKAPPNTDHCPPSLLFTTMKTAAERGFAQLREEALLPTGKAIPNQERITGQVRSDAPRLTRPVSVP